MQNAKMKMKICNLQCAIDQRGFTLVELLIAMAIASVVGMAGVAVFSSSNWAYKLNEDVAEAQQNARVAMERLSKDIRAAGFGLPDDPSQINISMGGTTWTSPITVTTSGGTGNPDSITILGIGYEPGKLAGGAINCPDATVPNKNNSTCIRLSAASDFFSGGAFDTDRKYINIGGAKYIELANSGHDSTNRILVLGTPDKLDRDYAVDTPVFIIQAVTYSIGTTGEGCSSLNPCLKSNDLTGLRGSDTQTVAESIEDIQFAYGVDADGDGEMDSATGFQNTVSSPITIAAVRVTVVAKARNKDMRGATFTRPAIEDHSASSPDNYRRRILTKILKVRNPRTGF